MASHYPTYRRLTGLLRLNGRSAVLETGDGELIFLVSEDDLASFHDQQVVAEGQMTGPDRLTLTWIASASA
ncbi:DUF5818 domain-containing protein [Novosphingobium sp. BW1]|uniref:DUF5818 domain-containing protein n=1 Tax=Novosphingobium sp. BW1 TaxID=2592621 RepID=UPI0011DEC61E|nr:DUF5818 domain-containing protein [Novosphingobium sp. BW1]TYC78747.1 hypothetical protein FMM79_20565 [Novosphingobium sp. BW1]